MHASIIASGLAIGLATVASGQNISVTFENLLPASGTAFTPVFVGLHDAGFDLFDPGTTASAGLERVAELGFTDTLTAEFDAADPNGVRATTTGGPIVGGGSRSLDFTVADPTSQRFLSFATMVVPTNDLFVGNGSSLEIFDAGGNFTGPVTIEIFGSNVWDAGTEVNNADDGAAFLAGIDGTEGTAEGGTIQLFFTQEGAADYLGTLVGRETAPGFTIASTFDEATPIARLTVVPAPGAAAVLGLGGLAAARRRR